MLQQLLRLLRQQQLHQQYGGNYGRLAVCLADPPPTMAAALLLLLCAFALLPAPTHTATPEPLQALRFHRPAPHHNSTQVSAYASPRGDLAASLGLPGRDLRYLDPKRPSVTQLAARRSCLLLSVGHVRAVVLPDALLWPVQAALGSEALGLLLSGAATV